jgi:hypothetical protein
VLYGIVRTLAVQVRVLLVCSCVDLGEEDMLREWHTAPCG